MKALAIGLDAFESSLLDEAMSRGLAPTLSTLVQSGRRVSVTSSLDIGSGAVWPTFLSGLRPVEHGVSGEWLWDATSMTIRRFDPSVVRPFWADLVGDGISVGTFDIPFAPTLGLQTGFEVSEWGPHDALSGSMEVGPHDAATVVAGHPVHAFHRLGTSSEDFRDTAHLGRYIEGAIEGVRLRRVLIQDLIRHTNPAFVLTVFPEMHALGHLLWHTLPDASSPLHELVQTIDDELGKLIEHAGPNCAVAVFSLHGMGAGRGVPSMLPELLNEQGFTTPASWRTGSWAERATSVLVAAKKRAPEWLRTTYHRRARRGVQLRLARPTLVEPHNWARTRAFAMPTDQHGYVRVNLAGRERDGSVTETDYEVERDRIEDALRALRTADGHALVAGIVRPPRDRSSTSALPDVIVHWTEAAHAAGAGIVGSTTRVDVAASHRTGEHTSAAFCIARGYIADALIDDLGTHDLHRALVAPWRKDGVTREHTAYVG